jgi:acetyltransferase-like isoleucine patch superfamily enzyme
VNQKVFYAGLARIGIPKEARVFEHYSEAHGFPSYNEIEAQAAPVTIGEKVFIGNNCTIYEGTEIGSGCVLEDNSRIGFDTRIGDGTRVMYSAFICDRVSIGENCRIAGFVCDAAVIKENCTVMGQLAHKYTVSDLAWGEVDEPSPVIEAGSIVGLGAQIIGGITIGAGTYVASGAIVTRDTPPNSVVTGINHIRDHSEWPGDELQAYFRRLSK